MDRATKPHTHTGRQARTDTLMTQSCQEKTQPQNKQRTPLYSGTSMRVNVCAGDCLCVYMHVHAPSKMQFHIKISGPLAKCWIICAAFVKGSFLLLDKMCMFLIPVYVLDLHKKSV